MTLSLGRPSSLARVLHEGLERELRGDSERQGGSTRGDQLHDGGDGGDHRLVDADGGRELGTECLVLPRNLGQLHVGRTLDVHQRRNISLQLIPLALQRLELLHHLVGLCPVDSLASTSRGRSPRRRRRRRGGRGLDAPLDVAEELELATTEAVVEKLDPRLGRHLGEPVQVELADKGGKVVVLKVLAQHVLGQPVRVLDNQRRPFGRPADLRVLLGRHHGVQLADKRSHALDARHVAGIRRPNRCGGRE